MGRLASSNLLVFGLSHAVIDASCAALVLSLLNNFPLISKNFFLLVLLYNALAFGLQPILGILVDKYRLAKHASIIGSILIILAYVSLLISPIIAVIVAGIGNALFHIGAGSIILNIFPKKAAAPGMFVAPGAIGLLVGGIIGKAHFIAWPFMLLLAIMIILIWSVKIPKIDYVQKKPVNSLELIIFLILLSVIVRSFIGSVMVFPWKSDVLLLVLLTVSIFFGKFFGGMIADRIGWLKTATISLLVSAPLLAFGASNFYISIVGMFLFNITMPITLTAISNLLPGRPGFAFGLTCLALMIGVLASFIKIDWTNMWLIFMTIIFSVLVLYFGLKYYRGSAHQS